MTSEAFGGAVTVEGKSLNLFLPDHPVRRFCTATVNNRYFGWLVLTLIFVNLMALALESPAVTTAANSPTRARSAQHGCPLFEGPPVTARRRAAANSRTPRRVQVELDVGSMINGSATDGVAAVATQHVASMFNLVLFNIVMIINVMFTIEMLLRIVSQGFYGPATARPVPPSHT